MARVILSSAVSRASGTIGDIEFRRYNGTMVAQKRQQRHQPWSWQQRQNRLQFTAHAGYAASVRADPALRKAYAAAGAKRKRPLNYWQTAVRDHATPPTISGIRPDDFTPDRGGSISITAWDDFAVTRVHVAVCDATGGIRCAGEAVIASGRWQFAIPPPAPGASPDASVVVTAFDWPGNFAIGTFSLS